MCIYSPMPHTLSYCALIGKCALIRSNTVHVFPAVLLSNGYIFKRSNSLFLPTFSIRVNSEREEFAPTGANSIL